MEPLHLKGGALSWEWTRRERFFTKQRRFLNADRKEGFSATVSPLALMHWFPIFGSLAHEGINPQRNRTPSRLAASGPMGWES